MNQPNILFIMTDQQRADAMGCSGGWVHTPNLDRIASEGVRFANAVTNSPVCIPARVSLITGRYPHNTTIWDNCAHDMPPETSTWWQKIRDAGYRTSLFGKTHLHRHTGDLRDREDLIKAYGMDDIDEIAGPRASARCWSHMTERWEQKGLWQEYIDDYAERFRHKPWVVRPSTLPLEEYADVYVGQQAKAYLENYNRKEPWFCHVSFGGPHEPWDTPVPYAGMYPPETMPLPTGCTEDLNSESLNGNLGNILRSAPESLSSKDIASMRANYAGNVTLIDDQIGELLKTVEARGELENTVIVFSSDHGEMNGDHGLIYKGHFLNGAVRVPLLVRTPETAARNSGGAVSESPVEWMDIGPTLVEYAGGELQHQQFARSLCSSVKDPNTEHRPFAVSEISRELMIMDRRWKCVFNREGEPYLLFDQINDPDETRNRVNDEDAGDILTRMEHQLFRHLVQTQVDIKWDGNA